MTTTTLARLPSYEANDIWMAMVGGTSVDFIPSTEIVGGTRIVTLRRKSGCRACGQPMAKGTAAIQFAYRWEETIRYRITESFMHPERCR